jgi:hypothetical protein
VTCQRILNIYRILQLFNPGECQICNPEQIGR